MRTLMALWIVAASLGLVAACSSDDDGSSGASPAIGCAADSRKDIYAAGLAKPAGQLEVMLVESRPGPPIRGTNALTIEIRDAAGSPLDGATVTVTPWMPDHAHGSAARPVVTSLGGGRYRIDRVYLAMAGLWQIKVGVQPATGGALEEAKFHFCLEG